MTGNARCRSNSSLSSSRWQESHSIGEECAKPDLADHETNGHAESLPESSPADVATCDVKYWSCPGANNLKAWLEPSLFISTGNLVSASAVLIPTPDDLVLVDLFEPAMMGWAGLNYSAMHKHSADEDAAGARCKLLNRSEKNCCGRAQIHLGCH